MARPGLLQTLGVLLFLFIPVVLYLFVQHPEPVGASLVAGVVLMLGHRFVARPYFLRVREAKCAWCNRWLEGRADLERFAVVAGDQEVPFVACPGHALPARRFFAWVDRLRLPLRLGIGAPLLALLGALAAAAFGRGAAVPVATEAFRLLIGLTVHLAALGALLGTVRETPPRAAFPLHNFSLLGIRGILWIFRLVGIWWIVAGAAGLFRLLG
ncbi:MAG TPA: hypothetical protein VLA66_11595 [Thermoanaerobaculia bacterium]|nr:hypothetical protein [Thermoanaerobaculia bacterium]